MVDLGGYITILVGILLVVFAGRIADQLIRNPTSILNDILEKTISKFGLIMAFIALSKIDLITNLTQTMPYVAYLIGMFLIVASSYIK